MHLRALVGALGLLVSLVSGCGSSGSAVECDAPTAAQCIDPDAGVPLPDGGEPDGGEPDPGAIVVDTAWLQAELGSSELQLIDTRARGYDEARLPGAIRLRPGDLEGVVDGVPSQVAPVEQAQAALREAGLRNGTIAVVYGEPPEYDPSRVVWALRYFRHGDVRYLDGGFDAWVRAGGALETEPPEVTPTDYALVGTDESLRVTGAWVLERLGEPPYDGTELQLVDARSEGEYAAGRIPTALSANWTRNLADGFLRAEPELGAIYAGLDPSATTIAYCVSGWRGSFAWLTLTALGYDDVRLYDGSWNEWGRGDFPVELE
jgi:thiosulfate/3-mercaptopyruvate sulfurtransferase